MNMKCPPYANQHADISHGQTHYYKSELREYILRRPTVSLTDALSYFNNGDCSWTERTFTDHFYRIRASINREKNGVIDTYTTQQSVLVYDSNKSWDEWISDMTKKT